MPTVTMTRTSRDRFVELADAVGMSLDPNQFHENPDGTVSVHVGNRTAERLATLDPDLDVAVVKLLDLVACGHASGYAH